MAPDEEQEAQKQIRAEMQRLAWGQIPFMTLGHGFMPMAMREPPRDVVAAPFPIFWNVRRAYGCRRAIPTRIVSEINRSG